FGLARLTQAAEQVTRPGELLGTPAYMAPEQAAGRGVSARSDLFSLGVVLYRTLAGVNPFQREDVYATLLALAVETPPPLRTVGPSRRADSPDRATRLPARAREERPAPAAEGAARLRAIGGREATTVALPAKAPAGTTPRLTSTWHEPSEVVPPAKA